MSTDRLPDRWKTRDFPVLPEVARVLDDGDPIQLDVVAAATGLAEKQVHRAFAALRAGDYIREEPVELYPSAASDRFAALGFGSYTVLTERGRRAVGLWPSGDSVDALVDALRQAEDVVTDPHEKTLIRRAGGAVASVSRDVMVDVVAAVVARQSGLG